jgi:SAM-dependent methyltransferase
MSFTSGAKVAVRRRIRGAAWQNPLVEGVLPVIDVADAVTRRARRLGHLPPYSLRIRSNGVDRQFGGREFMRVGAVIADDLERHAGLTATSDVLEIGCGVGRVALTLAERYPDLRFTGLDVDERVIDSCRSNAHLPRETFTFDVIDVATDLYNPGGGTAAERFTFPFPDCSFDVVYLISVFTHMFEPECANYAAEIRRMLRPGGKCALTVFVVDGSQATDWRRSEECYLRFPQSPRKMVGYGLETVARWFGQQPIRSISGSWRGAPRTDFTDTHADFQDMLVFGRSGG